MSDGTDRDYGHVLCEWFCAFCKAEYGIYNWLLGKLTIPLAGDWRVDGDGFSGGARLPGTLAAAHLGKRWAERDFQTTMDLPQSEPSCCLSGKLTTNPFVFFMDGETLRWQKGMWYNSRRNKS